MRKDDAPVCIPPSQSFKFPLHWGRGGGGGGGGYVTLPVKSLGLGVRLQLGFILKGV